MFLRVVDMKKEMFNFKQEHSRLDFRQGLLQAEETFETRQHPCNKGDLVCDNSEKMFLNSLCRKVIDKGLGKPSQ